MAAIFQVDLFKGGFVKLDRESSKNLKMAPAGAESK